MKITKFAHSCLLAETKDRKILVDPGSFTWDDGAFNLSQLDKVDRVVITHNHADHYSPEFLKAVLKKFPKSHIVCNEEVKESIENDGIQCTFRGAETDCIKPFEAPHESTDALGFKAPSNTGFHIKDELSHPGDSFTFSETKRILAVPFTAPWGSIMEGVDLVAKLKPEKIFLIHDWHFGEKGRKWLENALKNRFSGTETEFVSLEIGKTVEL